MRIRAVLEATGGTTTGLRVPPEVVEALGPSKRPKVRVSIGGHTWRSSIAPMGGESWLGVSAENRGKAGVAAGDELDVDLEPDTEERTITVPDDLAAALDPTARRAFDALSYSKQRAIVEPIEAAKAPATRQRRIDKAVEQLSGSA